MKIILTILLFCMSILAKDGSSVELSRVYRLGDCERAGNFTLLIDSDRFPNASPEQPVYIKVNFNPRQVLLCQTLIELDQPGQDHQPIYLPMVAAASGDSIAVSPANSIAIVRWRKGENAIWLKVTVPSSQWLVGSESQPSPGHGVQLSVGLDAAQARGFLSHSSASHNLPFASLADGTLASTALYFNLKDFLPAESDSLDLDLELYDQRTTGVETAEQIQLGERIGFLSEASGLSIASVVDQQLFPSRLIFPWVSHNQRYTSQISLQNRDAAPATARLQLMRPDGSLSQQLEQLIPAWGSFQGSISELFPDWPEGAGATLVAECTSKNLEGTWFTFFRQGCSQNSPGFSRALRYDYDPEYPPLFGQTLQFGSLPNSQDFQTAIVLLNLGLTTSDATLVFTDAAGKVVGSDSNLASGLEPFRPRAILLSDLSSANLQATQVFARSEGSSLVGALFLFNQQGDPAILNAENFDWPLPTLEPETLKKP